MSYHAKRHTLTLAENECPAASRNPDGTAVCCVGGGAGGVRLVATCQKPSASTRSPTESAMMKKSEGRVGSFTFLPGRR